MKNEIMLSAGIDIGTTTTHLIISKIGISVTNGFGTVPKAEITSKEILYKSPVYFTPLLPGGDINGQAVAEIIAKEYESAGVSSKELKSGAVIITGESACKGNSAYVLEEISQLAGDFVAAQAGSELESYLAGKGSGADIVSEQTGKLTANIDIGGGTTNIALFENGKCMDTCCLNIGGRMITSTNDGISVSKNAKKLLNNLHVSIKDFEHDKNRISVLCDILAEYIFSVFGLNGKSIPEYLITDHLLKTDAIPEIYSFSGGVAQCMEGVDDEFAYGDAGVLLAKAVKKKSREYGLTVQNTEHPIRATVIGAGQFSTEISGSTISYSALKLPIKNLPCICALHNISDKPCAICVDGKRSPSFIEVNETAEKIAKSAKALIKKNIPVIVITKEDWAKALGVCLKRKLPKDYPFLCADGIDCHDGDYIDIGTPVADGRAVPAVVKTLVFGG